MGVLDWLESLPLAVWVHESPSVWAQPTVLTLHTMGMAVLVGESWVLDLRLLGISRNVPLSAFRWVFPAVTVGLIVNLVTGVLLFAQRATTWGTSIPAAFISAMKRLAAQSLVEEHPSRLVQLLFYSHPPVRLRIEAARAFQG